MIDLSRNHVIEAGAGTGKTYQLVQAILQALFQKGIPLPNIVALTFTKKAAGEMKERVANELRRILSAPAMPEEYRSWGHRFEELQKMAREALDQIDRANISTIHSFAFSLLKRFPLALGLNPNSEVDEKELRYDEIFELEWPRWLAKELQAESSHEKEWLEILSRLSVADIRDLARSLSDFRAPLWALPLSDANLSKQIEPLYNRLRALTAGHPGEDKTGRLAAACEAVLGRAANSAPLSELPADLAADVRLEPGTPKAWSKEELRELKFFRKIAHSLLDGGDRLMALLTERLRPFVVQFRSAVVAEGFLSNDALLALACELVRRHHDIRNDLKEEFRMILVDEFQDTDPLQGELLLFLSEQKGGHAKRWKEVHLEAGKLFVVGDPKQSIYRFRGADISAYRQITDLILAQGGLSTPLQKSRRSHDQIIHVVNHSFSQIIREQKQLSPAYVPLEPLRPHEGLPLQGIELRLASADDRQSTEEAEIKEAKHAARWIAQNVGTLECLDKEKGRRPLAYKDIALVFRSTPPMRVFVEALRRHDIPFVVEGERYFYSMPEITDLINFLRVIENPHDRVALVGFLRSPLGGFTDGEILDLKEANTLDVLRPLPSNFPDARQHLWTLVQSLQARAGRVPLKVLLRHLFDESYVLELAARSYHRDQTVANILKLKRLLESFAEEGVTTLRALLAKVKTFMEDDRLEGESPLADETYNAVRLLTIHKAKGLEFPVIMLPCLHKGKPGNRRTDAVSYDWETERLGLRTGKLQNLNKLILDREAEEREREEEKRVFYVAMTRARERVILSGGIHLHRPSNDSYLEWFGATWGLTWNEITPGPVVQGPARLEIDFVDNKESGPARPAVEPPAVLADFSLAAFTELWQKRTNRCSEAFKRKAILRPSTSDQEAGSPKSSYGKEHGNESEERILQPEQAKMLGTLVHRFLEQWDFACEKCEMPARLRLIANGYFASLGLLRKPFPDPKTGPLMLTPDDPMAPLVDIVDEAQTILADFIGSEAYDDIKNGTVIGRETPFFYALPDGALVRGTIDLIYRQADGTLIIADYKTDRHMDAAAYQAQMAVYREAVERTLGEKAQCRLIYLRASEAIVI